MINIQKAAVIGCGFVGASTAFSLVQKGLFSELVLIDANKEKGGRRGYGPQSWKTVCSFHEDLRRRL